VLKAGHFQELAPPYFVTLPVQTFFPILKTSHQKPTRSLLLQGGITLALGASLFLSSCKKEPEPVPSPSGTPTQPALQPKPVPQFNAQAALEHAARQVSFGPRIPNTPAHDSAVAYFRSILSPLTSAVQFQDFIGNDYNGGQVRFTNVLASFNPEATDRILLLAHWDSKPWAEEDPNQANKNKPIPAANDGASGVGILLELAKIFKDNPPPIGVDLLLDDGEDYGKFEKDQLDRYFLGVKHFVQTKPPTYQPRVAILLDMVGDRNAEFKMEGNSVANAPSFTNFIWETAENMGLSKFKKVVGADISDDHIPLIQAGIKSVDIIDADLVGHNSPDPKRKYWHTMDDTMENLSTETMDQVGRLLLDLIYDKFPRNIRTLQ